MKTIIFIFLIICQQGFAQNSATLGKELLINIWKVPNSWKEVGGAYRHIPGDTNALTTEINVISGKDYIISWEIKFRSTGRITFSIGNITGSTIIDSIDNTSMSTDEIKANTTGLVNFSIIPTRNFDGTISSISVKQLILPISQELTINKVLAITPTELSLYNTAIGVGSLKWNTTGHANTCLGVSSLGSNTTGFANVAIGGNALARNLTGWYNTAIGLSALSSNKYGYYDVAIGTNSLLKNTTGADNTGIGVSALQDNTTGNFNTGIGLGTLYLNEVGSYNTALGAQALNIGTSGSNNIGIGFKAGFNCAGSGNIFIGTSAGFYETGSNKLYISNNSSKSPLVYGDFSNNYLTINGYLNVIKKTRSIAFYLQKWGTLDNSIAAALDTNGTLIINNQYGKTQVSLSARSSSFINGRIYLDSLIVNEIESSGNIILKKIGNKLYIKEGTNASMGDAELINGKITVLNKLVTANSRIFLTINRPGGTVGSVYVSNRISGVSFTINSTSAHDESTVSWLIIEPYQVKK